MIDTDIIYPGVHQEPLKVVLNLTSLEAPLRQSEPMQYETTETKEPYVSVVN